MRFGANQQDDMLSEIDVMSYKVYFSDEDLNMLGDGALATVDVMNNKTTPAFCGCDKTRYSVSLQAVQVPMGATGFMVVSVDNFGFEMPVGTYIGGLSDFWTTTTTTTVTTKTTTVTTATLQPIVAGARTVAGTVWAFIVLLVAASQAV